MDDERIIGRKAICAAFDKLYGVSSWFGVRHIIKRDGMPLRHTPSGKPYFFKHELAGYDDQFRKADADI